MINFIKKVLQKTLFYDRWTCNGCGKEIFENYFCEDCLNKITQISGNKCAHCGRLTVYPVKFCDSCKEVNINFDRALSVFDYKEPISYLIQNFLPLFKSFLFSNSNRFHNKLGLRSMHFQNVFFLINR